MLKSLLIVLALALAAAGCGGAAARPTTPAPAADAPLQEGGAAEDEAAIPPTSIETTEEVIETSEPLD